ncbi:hypothetical protein BO71DRAFT_419933 [Aspergillus ellipticus CBS 707.79]|uniref:Uncharacterized protein n=1 Tax=Aspergillus ellipticus CBS 707.79 TaxID=1448320 RepID=A0A319D8L3_9EURO|nr:hypothetical protein BO71DRAFT_419933 [Aspergillus ellipticus CBS 707.79]
MCSSVDIEYLHQELSTAEAIQICERFHGTTWRPGRQVMWSGVPRAIVQQWADAHGRQTLTTAMGPLMQNWSRYMHGASALFASHIAQDGGTVTVVTPPPPERFNPHGGTNHQAIEEPILKGERGPCCVKKIELVHPTVPGAEEFCYEIWPEDETGSWTAKFAKASKSAPHPQWRHPKPKRQGYRTHEMRRFSTHYLRKQVQVSKMIHLSAIWLG